jgi:polyhydroxyalkanoate synthesis regulator phasin
MNFNKKLAVAVSGAVLLMAGQFALADSTTDIVDALVSKGVLTEEEGKLISKGATSKAKADEKANKSRVKVSDVIDNAEFYGNMRARYEYRDGEGVGATADSQYMEQKRNRARGKLEFGIKTNSGKWYSDVLLATGTNTSGISSARSDNFTFGGGDTNYNAKEGIYLKRAMLGWTPNDWLTLEAGRMSNPLYTTPMVWDGDYSVTGFQEKVKFTVGSTEIFGVAGQWANGAWDSKSFQAINGSTDDRGSASANLLFAFQGGLKTPVNDASSAKIAVTQYIYGGQRGYKAADYVPGTNITKAGTNTSNSVNNLDITEIPAELNYIMPSSGIGMRIYGDYVYNHSAQERADAAGATYSPYGGEDTSWLLGLRIASAKDLKSFEGNKAKAGDWSGNLWYQEIGIFAQDPNLNDSDFFDSRLNMKGYVFKGQYNIEDNVFFNIAYGHGKRLNGALGTPYTAGNDLALNIDKMNLLQLDLTYKF